MKKMTLLPALLLAAVALPAGAQTAAARPKVDLSCEAMAAGPTIDCLVKIASNDGKPLDGANVTLNAMMPSMPMAHHVKPAAAAATGKPGEYRGTLVLEMAGVWAVQIDLVAGALRDRAIVRLMTEECPAGKRCAVAPAAAAKP